MSAYAYRLAGVSPSEASDHALAQRMRHAGPWQYVAHPDGGTLAFLADWPEKGKAGSKSPDDYGSPVDVGDGLWYLPPKSAADLYDYAREDHAGVDVDLISGRTVSIPCALVQHRQFRLSRGAKDRFGDPVTEYGRLATQVFAKARKQGSLDEDDPDLWRLIELAFAQCYRVTAELLDDLRVFAREDVDTILGAIWWGDPKALSPASDGDAPDSASSAPATPN